MASLISATTSLASLLSHILNWWFLQVHHFHLQAWTSTACLTAPPGIWKVLAQVFWTTGGNISETKSISKNMVNISPSHRPLTSELVRVPPLKHNK